jgi:hypothetical protein
MWLVVVAKVRTNKYASMWNRNSKMDGQIGNLEAIAAYNNYAVSILQL